MAVNRMKRFGIFIGTWNTRGEVRAVDAAPATTLVATDTYRWIPGGHFIVHEVDARFGDDVTRSMEIIGYDGEARTHLARSYDDRGTSEVFRVSLRGRRWTIEGDTVRFDGKFDLNGNRLQGLWEMKSRKWGWKPWIELELTRA